MTVSSRRLLPRLLMLLAVLGSLAACTAPASQPSAPAPRVPVDPQPFDQAEIVGAAESFFGETSEGLANLVQRAFAEQGRPNAYIVGREGSGAAGVGLRYGTGQLRFRDGSAFDVYWQGPSVGWDIGGNASKVFTLVYNLRSSDQLFQRIAGVDGSLYLVAGFGMNYQRSDGLTLAPIRTGVGLRAGANVGYLHYTPEARINPF